MKLPFGSKAIVPDSKLRDYLLSLDHPEGRHKARQFFRLGFHPEAPQAFRIQLLAIAKHGTLMETVSTDFGKKYVVDGTLKGPRGRVHLRTVWIVEPSTHIPRLVTAYPLTEVER